MKEDLIRIEAHISGEVTRLIQENGKLHREIATLMSSAGATDTMKQMRTFLAEERKRAEATSRQDREEVKRLRGIEAKRRRLTTNSRIWRFRRRLATAS